MLPHRLKAIMFDNVSKISLRYVTPVPYTRAKGLVAEVYEQAAEEYFLVGAITTHSVNPTLLAAMWCGGREIILTDGVLPRGVKEALGVSFAQLNGCTYCEDMMVAVMHGSEHHQLASAVRGRKQNQIEDDRTRALHEWALNCRNPRAEILRSPPFSAKEAPEMIGTAFMYNYLNRYVKVFFDGTPLNPPFSSQSIKTAMFHSFGVELRATVTKTLQPGRAAALLPGAELPGDLSWAAPNPNIARAVSRLAAAIETAAKYHVPARARAVVRNAVANWHGEEMGLSRGWIEPHLDGLDKAESAAAKVGLLAALAPTQISDDVIEAFRRSFTGDAALVTTVSWSALAAARRLASWLAAAAPHVAGQTGEAAKAA